jgi:hypothetical protein
MGTHELASPKKIRHAKLLPEKQEYQALTR